MMKHMKRIGAVILTLSLILTLFAACGKPVEKEILGSWRDSTGAFGLDLKEGGNAVIVAGDFTIPILNIKLNNGQEAIYTVTTDEEKVHHLDMTVNFVMPIELAFTFTLEDDVLKLHYTKANLDYTLVRVQEEADAAPASDAAPAEDAAPVSQ